MLLHELLNLPMDKKHIVSLCGGGGKTSTMMTLAEESRGMCRTAIFTTTHIRRPEGTNIMISEPFSREACLSAWAEGNIAAAGREIPEKGKFGPPSGDEIRTLLREAEAVYIEADGSRQMPLKYPAEYEPVILPETTHIIVVAGLSALDQPAEKVIHRLPLAREHMDIPAGPVTEEMMAALLWEGYGHLRPCFFLNQADTAEIKMRGERVCSLLRRMGASGAVTGAVRSFPASGILDQVRPHTPFPASN